MTIRGITARSIGEELDQEPLSHDVEHGLRYFQPKNRLVESSEKEQLATQPTQWHYKQLNI